MSKYDDLVRKLKEIFQIDRPELDFGVYRILNARAGEINNYLDNRLKERVQEALAHAGNANLEQLRKELAETERNAEGLGMKADDVPKVRELRQRITELAGGSADHENVVFSHLLTFFSRYYDSGDFISQRRYKGDTYAIPYAGEEVVLHWANKDQYYTKSGENFANYRFKLADGRSVHFRLMAADTAKDNRKDNDKERRFVLIEEQTRVVTDDEGDEYEEELQPVEELNGELLLRFEYKPMPKGSKQDDLMSKAVQIVLASLPHPYPNPPLEGEGIIQLLPLQGGGREGDGVSYSADWKTALSKREPTEKNPQRTLLEKHLTTYTQKNSADYFIHKDLGRFLRGELDFYIKNEVMNLDDVQNAERFADIEKNLRMIQCLRAIALDLITFLAQLEDFQKKLWLKKKFVVAAHYCITLDRIIKDAPDLLVTIAANERQWEQWDTLGILSPCSLSGAEGSAPTLPLHAEPITTDYLREHPFLMVDTALFDTSFKDKLLAAIDNLDESVDGLLIHGDNYQALNLLQERYREQVKCIYIDPPYNTGGDGFTYKDNYQHSSWNTAISEKISESLSVLTDLGACFISIDDTEVSNLRMIGEQVFGPSNFISNVIWEKKYTRSNDARWFSDNHDHILVFAKDKNTFRFNLLPRTDEQNKAYTNPDNHPKGPWKSTPLHAKSGNNSNFSFKFKNGISWLPPVGTYPRFSDETLRKFDNNNEIWFGVDGTATPSRKSFLCDVKDGLTCTTIWKYDEVGHNHESVSELKSLFPSNPFANPKPTRLISRIHQLVGEIDSLYLDYFAGSGTTGHAVISLNRQDKGQRKYILVEQGEYFDTVLKPRIQKVVYSADWKDGNATAPQTGISHAFKVLKIESYEDTLNNLELRRSDAQQSLLDSLPAGAQEDYLLRYMLDIESQGSILSVDSFRKPFDCKLKVAVDSAGAFEERTIDLVETFNYLIGLRVKTIDAMRERGIVMVQGVLPTGEKTLVLWRDCEQVDYEALNRFCDRHAINPKDSEFEVVYINGDHNIPAVLTTTEDEGGITKTLKLRQIEPEFLSRMFDWVV